jgi:membrane protein DedA with SNARE-associated domain
VRPTEGGGTPGPSTLFIQRGKGLFARERLFASLAIAGVGVILVVLFLFRDRIGSLSELGYLGVFLMNVAGSASIVIPIPGLAAVLVAGGLWNPVLVGIAGGLGMTLGELSGYALGYGGRSFLKRDHPLRFLEGWMRKAGGPILFVFALIPNPFFDFAGVVAGSQRFPVHLFLLWIWPGKTIKSLIVAFAGAYGLLAYFLGPTGMAAAAATPAAMRR